MYLETRSKFYDTDLETAVIKTKQKSLSKLESQITIKMIKYSAQAIADANKVWYHKSPTDTLSFECPAPVWCSTTSEVLLSHNAKY